MTLSNRAREALHYIAQVTRNRSPTDGRGEYAMLPFGVGIGQVTIRELLDAGLIERRCDVEPGFRARCWYRLVRGKWPEANAAGT